MRLPIKKGAGIAILFIAVFSIFISCLLTYQAVSSSLDPKHLVTQTIGDDAQHARAKLFYFVSSNKFIIFSFGVVCLVFGTVMFYSPGKEK